MPIVVPGFIVRRGRVALPEIVVEVKIVATAHSKQIDRVGNDLKAAANELKEKSPRAITVGVVGVNYSEAWTTLEKDREYPSDKKSVLIARVADDICGRLENAFRNVYDEFLIFKFRATNRPPFPFRWLDSQDVERNYGATLVRIASSYENVF